MVIRSLALGAGLVASLAAQGQDAGFGWVGLRGGPLALDPQDHAKAAHFLGGQAGMVFDQQRYGWSLEGSGAHAKSDLFPAVETSHREFSATLLTGLTGDALGRFWPYFGVGLGSVTVARTSLATQTVETGQGAAFHASLGWLHRPGLHLIWGLEGRYLMAFTRQDRKDLQASLLFGMTWGGKASGSRREPAPAGVDAPGSAGRPAPALPAQPVVKPAEGSAADLAAGPGVGQVTPATVPVPPATSQPTPPAVMKPEGAAATAAAPPIRDIQAAPSPVPVDSTPILRPQASSSLEDRKGPPGLDERLDERLEALRRGDMERALELGRQRIRAIPAGRWTLRLEIANLPATLAHAVQAFQGERPDLFIAPFQLKGGKTAYQLFLGEHATKAEAERAAKGVPSLFLEGGQRPKPFLVSAIPAR